MNRFLQSWLSSLLLLLASCNYAEAHPFGAIATTASATAADNVGLKIIPRGGASGVKNGKKRRKYSSFLGWRERVEDTKDSLESFTERKTFFSRELMPQSEQDAEWAAFLKGWLLVSLPIPLPLMFVALVAYSTLMSFSQWDDSIKRKFIIGLYHGVLVFAVLLREMDEKIDAITRPRQLLILINIATNLFLGKTGRFKATKFLMDTSIFGTLFYILYQYFDTPNFGDTSGKSWYR